MNSLQSLHSDSLCGTLCATAVQQVLEHAVVTRGEIEEFSQLLLNKDNQIKNVQDKLSDLEVKVSVYKEMINIHQMKMKDKNDLIESLKLSVDLLKANSEQNINTIPSSKSQIDQLTGHQNTSGELERISKELRAANDRILDKNAVIKKIQAEKAEETALNQKVMWQLENCKAQIENLEETKKEMKETISDLSAQTEEKESQLSEKMQQLESLKAKIDCIENELIQKNAALEEIETQMKDFQAANELIKENSSKLVFKIKEKNNELEQCEEHVLKLESKVDNLEKELILKNTALDNSKSQITDSQTAIEKLRESNSKLAYEVKKMLHKQCSDQLKLEVELNFFHSIDDWTVVGIQNSSSSEELNTLSTYQNGFNTPNGNYWIGLERLHRLTSNNFCDLYIQFDDGKVIKCDNFVVGSKEDKYRLKRVGCWTGDTKVYMRKYEGGSFRIYNSTKLGWWLPEM